MHVSFSFDISHWVLLALIAFAAFAVWKFFVD